jgi:serine/threonine protein kinase
MESKIALKKEFELIESIGRGVSSEVYKGLRLDAASDFSEVVAIKIFKSTKFRKKFQNELKNLSKINHPNIISIKDWGQSEEKFYLVTEYIHGQDLLHILKIIEPKDKSLKKYILNQIYEGLKELKNKGIAHGDLKPSNIMVSIKGELKLIDISFDDLGQVFATPEFSAPETLSGQSANFEADLYSLGVISQKMDLVQKRLLSIEPGDRIFEAFKGLNNGDERERLSCLVRQSFLKIEHHEAEFEFTQELSATPLSYNSRVKKTALINQKIKHWVLHLAIAFIFGFGLKPQFPVVKELKLRSLKAYEYWNNGSWETLPLDVKVYFQDSHKSQSLKFRTHTKEKNLVISADMDFSKNLVIDAL